MGIEKILRDVIEDGYRGWVLRADMEGWAWNGGHGTVGLEGWAWKVNTKGGYG